MNQPLTLKVMWQAHAATLATDLDPGAALGLSAIFMAGALEAFQRRARLGLGQDAKTQEVVTAARGEFDRQKPTFPAEWSELLPEAERAFTEGVLRMCAEWMALKAANADLGTEARRLQAEFDAFVRRGRHGGEAGPAASASASAKAEAEAEVSDALVDDAAMMGWWQGYLAQHPPPASIEQAELDMLRTTFVSGATLGSAQVDLIQQGRRRRFTRVIRREAERVVPLLGQPGGKVLFTKAFEAGGEAFAEHYLAALAEGGEEAADALVENIRARVNNVLDRAQAYVDPAKPLAEQWWDLMMRDDLKAHANTTGEAFLRLYYFSGVIFAAAHGHLLHKGRKRFDRSLDRELTLLSSKAPWKSEDERSAGLSIFGMGAFCYAEALIGAQSEGGAHFQQEVEATAQYAADEIEKLRALQAAPENRQTMN